MSPRAFNRIMLDIGVGTNRKVRRLSVPERWTFVAGVLPIAAQSPIRGSLFVATSIPATPKDIAEQAGVTVAVARKTLAHLRTLGMLEVDDELGVEWVHDWADYQPEPIVGPKDLTGARRQALYRNKPLRLALRERDGDDCRYCGKTVDWTDRRGSRGGTYDHVDPAGRNDESNLVVSCRGCNSIKGNRTPADAGLTLRPAPGLTPGPTPSRSTSTHEGEVEGKSPRFARDSSLRSESVESPNSDVDQQHQQRVVKDLDDAQFFRRVFAAWQEQCKHPNAKPTRERREKVLARRREKYTEQQILAGIKGAAVNPPVGDDGVRYDDLVSICRNGAQLERYIGRAGNAAATGDDLDGFVNRLRETPA